MDRPRDSAEPVIVLGVLAILCGCAGGSNRPPRIAPIPALSVVVGDTLTLPLLGDDPDGDPVRFECAGAPEGARVIGADGGTWRFEFAPMASQASPGGRRYDLVFAAIDGRGGRAEAATTLTVWPEGSIPVFLPPFAWTLNLGEEDHLAVPIRVRDDDTARVSLALRHGIEGARLDQVDGHTATFYLRPRPDQVTAGTVLTFTVAASDADHPEVLQDFAVLLINADLFGGCPGSPPSAYHPMLSDRHDPGPYPIEVRVLDPDSEVRSVEAFWSAIPGLDEPDMNRVPLEAGAGGVFRGSIPDLSAAGGQGRLVFYHFRIADDDDQTSDYCDHRVRLPRVGEFAIAVYGPEAPDACVEDPYALEDAPALPREASGLRLCGGRPDEFHANLVAGQWLAVRARPMSAGGPLRVRMEDPAGSALVDALGGVFFAANTSGPHRILILPPDATPQTYALDSVIWTESCEPDPFEPNQPPDPPARLSAGRHDARLCPADLDEYRFDVEPGQAASVTLEPADPSADLSLALFEEGSDLPLRVAPETGAVRRVVFETDRSRTLRVQVTSSGLRAVEYALTLAVQGQETLCEEDLLGVCSTPDQAPMLFEGTWSQLKLCPGKADYLATALNGGERLTATVQTSADSSAPALAILGGAGQLLAEAQVSGSEAVAQTVAPGPGPVWFRIGPAADVVVSYSLWFQAEDPSGVCTPDRMEPNDSVEKSSAIPLGVTPHLTLCSGDRDVFAIRVGAWQTVWAYVLFGSTSVHASLQDGSGSVLATGAPAEYGEEVFLVSQAPMTVHLVVEPAGGVGWYDVLLDVE